MSGAAGWLSAAERGTVLGMRFIVWCYRVLGRRLCAYVIVPVVAYFFLTDRKARTASYRYLERLRTWAPERASLPRPPGTRSSFLHFREFGLNILDRVSFLLGDGEEFVMVVHGREHLDRLAAEKRGALLVSAHLGSFDALRLLADREGVKVNVVMFLRNARMINAVFANLNPRLQLPIIHLDPGSPRAVFEIRACLQRGELVGLLGDRVGLEDGARTSAVPFLGVPATFPLGPFLLGSALKCPILFIVGLRVNHRTYEVFVEPLAPPSARRTLDRAEEVQDLLSRYAGRLEAYCARAPYQWFNFYDFWGAPAGGPRCSSRRAGVWSTRPRPPAAWSRSALISRSAPQTTWCRPGSASSTWRRASPPREGCARGPPASRSNRASSSARAASKSVPWASLPGSVSRRGRGISALRPSTSPSHAC